MLRKSIPVGLMGRPVPWVPRGAKGMELLVRRGISWNTSRFSGKGLLRDPPLAGIVRERVEALLPLLRGIKG